MPRAKVSKATNVAKAQKGIVLPAASDSALALVSSLAEIQLQRERDVANAEDALAEAKRQLQQVKEVDLPEAMKEAGVKTFTTVDGTVVTVKSEVQVNITEANKPAAFQWLIDNGFGGLLKLDVEVHFDRGDREKAEKLAAQLSKKGIDTVVKQNVHPQTLKSFAKERIADTESDLVFPLELFGARPYSVSSVKPSKK